MVFDGEVAGFDRPPKAVAGACADVPDPGGPDLFDAARADELVEQQVADGSDQR